MNHRAKNLPPHWQEWVANHPKLSIGHLTPEFNNFVRLQFEDGGMVFFNDAFAVVDEEHREIGVFTEHCGYHVFYLPSIETYNTLTYTSTLRTKKTPMGIDYNIHYGSYIEIKTNGLKRPKVYDYQACNNSSCSEYKEDKIQGKFCAVCGKSLEMISETVEEEWDVLDMCHEMGISDQVSPECCDDDDTQLFFPYHDSLKSGVVNIKYENMWEDLSGLDVKEEIAKVKEYCIKALDVLEKMYGVKPVIKWGILSSVG